VGLLQLLRFIACCKMSGLNDGSRMAREAQPRPDTCYKGHSSRGEVGLCGGRWVIGWVALGALTWKGMKVGWKQANICDGVAFGLVATLVDDFFVGPDPALDGVGAFLEEDFERFGEYVAIQG
jgi:hypothetical protein